MSTVNLLPNDYIERRRQYRANVMCLILFAVVIAGVIGAAVVSQRSQKHTLEVRDWVNASYADAVRLIDQMRELQARRARMLTKAEVAASLVERVPRSYLVAVVANALPEGTSLVQFELFPKTIRNTSAKTSNKKTKFSKIASKRKTTEPRFVMMIEVLGRAATDVQVAQFMASLLPHPLLDSVELVYSEEKLIDKVAIREFRIVMALKPNVDVIDVLPKGERQKPTAAKELAQAPAGARP